MKRLLLSLILLAGATQLCRAQSDELFSYGTHKATLEEFKRQFFKNNPAESVTRDTAKYYLGLFINFKLKVQQAKDMGLDTASDFVNEMAQYRRQLAQPYMVDTSANDMLIKEAYEHMKTEVKASHIMIAISYDALPKDTMIAWQRAVALKNMLKSVSFDSLARDSSEDRSAKTNLGSLGYFTAFDMIYPFEMAAYNTRVGEIYGPFRTQFGYHIIKVWDKRPARPKMELAHIMLRLNQGATDEEIIRVKQKIDSIASEIHSGKNTFESLALEFSEDANSRSNSGKLGLIESTDRGLPSEFVETAFALKNDGDVSQPVKTEFGWHLIKRYRTEQLKPIDSLYNDIKRKVLNPRDERFNLSKQAVIRRIKNEYNFTENPAAINNFITARANETILAGEWKHEELASGNEVMFSLRDRKYTFNDFSRFIETNQQAIKGDLTMAVKNLYNSFVEESVWGYEEEHLGEKQPKYRYLVEEYHDGILLFNLSEKKVWNKGITDTAGLKDYYEANKTRYMWKDRLEATIYECRKEEVCKKVQKWVKKKYADTTISKMAHEIDPLGLAIKMSKYQAGEHPAIDMVKWKKGKYSVTKDGKYYYVVVKNVLPAQPKALSEVRGPMTSEYQASLEKLWIEDLKKEYPVVVNQETFDRFLATLPR